MRLLCSLLLVAAPLASAAAGCTKDTTQAARTLFRNLHLAALHVDENGGTAVMNGKSEPVLELRLAVAICRWPSYTMAVVGGSHMADPTTTYIASGSESYHPRLYASWSGVELQRRWRDSSIIHPMISLAVGRLRTAYEYSVHRIATDSMEYHKEGAASATYFTPAAGIEMSLFKHITTYLIVGARKVGTLETPALERGGFDGHYVAFGFGFGKFR
jgi:hypothetical protein